MKKKSHNLRIFGTLFTTALVFPGVALAAGFSEQFRESACDIIYYMGGSLGGLLTSASILVAIVSSAFGNFRAFGASIIVGIGSYALGDIVKVQFGDLGCSTPPPSPSKGAEVMILTDAELKKTNFERAALSPAGTEAVAEDDGSDKASEAAWKSLSAEEE